MTCRHVCVTVALFISAAVTSQAREPFQSLPTEGVAADEPSLADAQRLFYGGHYRAAARLTLDLRVPDTPDLASYELRSSALLFQLKALLDGHPGDDGLK